MYMYVCLHFCLQKKELMTTEAMNLKKRGEGYIKGFGGGKGKREM